MPRMLPDGRRLGAHLPLGAGMVKAVERAHEIGADAIQIFADNPTAWRRRAAPPTELPAFRERLAAYDIGPVAIHAVVPRQPGRARAGLLRALRGDPRQRAADGARASGRASSTSTSGRIVAPASTAGIDRLADGARRGSLGRGRRRRRTRPMLVLENSPGSGFGLGHERRASSPASPRPSPARGVADERVGFCLDAAHAWGAGHRLSRPGRDRRASWPTSTRASGSTGW